MTTSAALSGSDEGGLVLFIRIERQIMLFQMDTLHLHGVLPIQSNDKCEPGFGTYSAGPLARGT